MGEKMNLGEFLKSRANEDIMAVVLEDLRKEEAGVKDYIQQHLAPYYQSLLDRDDALEEQIAKKIKQVHSMEKHVSHLAALSGEASLEMSDRRLPRIQTVRARDVLPSLPKMVDVAPPSPLKMRPDQSREEFRARKITKNKLLMQRKAEVSALMKEVYSFFYLLTEQIPLVYEPLLLEKQIFLSQLDQHLVELHHVAQYIRMTHSTLRLPSTPGLMEMAAGPLFPEKKPAKSRMLMPPGAEKKKAPT